MTAIVNSKVITSTEPIFLPDTMIYAAQKTSKKTIPEPKTCVMRFDLTLGHALPTVFGLSALISPLSSDSLPCSGSAKLPSLIAIFVIFYFSEHYPLLGRVYGFPRSCGRTRF
jgi:hypothetical protein